jgi:hypothetical protein
VKRYRAAASPVPIYAAKDQSFRTVIEFYIDTQYIYWTDILLDAETLIEGLDSLISTMIRDNFDGNYGAFKNRGK